MKKKIVLVNCFGLLVIVLAHWIFDSIYVAKPVYTSSKSFADARENGMLVAKYKIIKIDNAVLDSLKKYNYDIHDITFWAEHQSGFKSQWIFFYPRVYTEALYLNYTDLVVTRCDPHQNKLGDFLSGRLPELALVPYMSEDEYAPLLPLHSYRLGELSKRIELKASFIVGFQERLKVPLGRIIIEMESEYLRPEANASLFSTFRFMPFLLETKCDCCK